MLKKVQAATAFLVFAFAAFVGGYAVKLHVEPTACDPVTGKLVVKSPTSAEVGELVRFDARESDVSSLVWEMLPPSKDFEVSDDGKRAYFSARSGGTYVAIVAAAKGDQAFLAHKTVVVEGGTVDPPPGPGPDPLVVKLQTWLKEVPDYEGKDKHIAGMAAIFSKIAEGDTKPEMILEATAVANSALLADKLDVWVGWLDKLGSELDAMSDAGKLVSKDDYSKVWKLIAQALGG